jgi:hypothetical protein
MTTRKEIYDRLYGQHNIFKWKAKPDETGANGHDASAIRETIADSKPHACIELGVWKGMSMIFAAKHLPANSFILGVDTFLGGQENWRRPKSMPRLENGYPAIFEICVGNIIKNKVQKKVLPWMTDTRSAIELCYLMKWRFDWAHVDAGRSYFSVIQDLRGLQTIMNKGFILVNDYWQDHVRDAVKDFCKGFECTVEKQGPKAVIYWHGESRQLQKLWGQG